MDGVQSSVSRITSLCATATALLWLTPAVLRAQETGPNLRGDAGLKSGSQPPPGIYFVVPAYYRADYYALEGPRGNDFPNFQSGSIHILYPVLSVVTPWKFLGAYYGAAVAGIFSNQAVGAAVGPGDLARNNTLGTGDIYVQPISLGWHTKQADFIAAWGFHAPTGNGIRTLDMWAFEYIAGTTVYLDKARKWNAAATMWYTVSLPKGHSNIDVGDFLSLKGGIGRAFLKGGAANAGLAYSFQWKTTHDSGTALPPFVPILLSHAYALGPEISLPLFAKGGIVGLLDVRYTFEFANVYNFQGNNLFASFTLVHFFKRK
jgi:Putative MetA-pathway of phenol degradation